MPQTTAELPEVMAQERRPSVRSLWLRQVILWHWVSSGVCLAGMLLFTVTGITLNHAAEITASPKVTKLEAQLPPALQSALKRGPAQGKSPLPAPVADWLAQRFSIHTMAPHAEWSDGEVYVSLPRPGGDAWLAMDRAAGTVVFESTSRGWVSYLNDLHKGRHTGPAWSIFIDVLAAACLVFTLTGFLLLQTHAAKRPSTWPLVALGLIAPLLLMLIFVHR
jgi:hypothetical protein